MTESTASVVGGVVGFLLSLGMWFGFFMWYAQGSGLGAIFILWEVMFLATVTGVPAYIGGSLLGSALARRSMEHD